MAEDAVSQDDIVIDPPASTSDVGIAGEFKFDKQRRKRPRPRRKRRLTNATKTRKTLTGSVRAQEVRHEMFAHGQPVAPYNTTQFLIEDHGDVQNIDAQLINPSGSQRHSRTRDSSFSVDSDVDFYSSPEDEEEFLTKEFSLEYQDFRVERLNAMPKSDIIQDYLMLESRFDKSLEEIEKLRGGPPTVGDSGRDTDASSKSEGDVNEKLRLANVENRRLRSEVESLKRQIAQILTSRQSQDDSADSVDSESDSSSSSSGSSHSSGSCDSKPTSPPEMPVPGIGSPVMQQGSLPTEDIGGDAVDPQESGKSAVTAVEEENSKPKSK